MPEPQDHITQAIQSIKAGEANADLIALVYDQLHAIATHRMRAERAGHTLQATALVNEACMRLLGDDGRTFEDRRHFFGAAGEAMRRILVDHARKRDSAKRGGGQRRIPMTIIDLAENPDLETVLALNDALDALEAEDPGATEVVRLRFFSGLTVAETAEVMGTSERSVARDWAYARAKLFAAMSVEGGADGP